MFSSNTSQVSNAATYIEDVFSTYLYTGTTTNLNIVNGIDLAGKGGLVWEKNRSAVGISVLEDTARGLSGGYISTATQSPQSGGPAFIQSFNNNGFTVNIGVTDQFVSWTFRKQPKFFDIVTYTGDGTGLSRQIAHSLGTAPGCIIIKATNATTNWKVYHRSLGNNFLIELNTTDAATNQGTQVWSSQATYFSTLSYNASGTTYVAYLFAHNAGGFGLTGTDNVISCGSFTTSGYAATVDLGYEPQWVLAKSTTNPSNWFVIDNMRGFCNGAQSKYLSPNLSDAESTGTANALILTSTGFSVDVGYGPWNGLSTDTYIYIAIRRGPMKTPTTGTSVFAMDTQGSTTPRPPSYKSGFPVDWAYTKDKTSVNNWFVGARLTGTNYLSFDSTASQTTSAAYTFDYQNGWLNSTAIDSNRQSWMFGRAPSFMDVVCYTGNGTAGRTVTHNLGVAPEMMIVKARNYSGGRPWPVYHSGMGNTKFMYLNTADAEATNTWWNNTNPTSTVFTVGSNSVVNFSGTSYVAYLFASCPGVSKVGSYTGTGATQTISCGFAARFVLIKRTDSTGNWVVWDTARGMVAGTDPRLEMNTTNAQTNDDWVYTNASGFQIVTTDATVNASGGSYIYLAIA